MPTATTTNTPRPQAVGFGAALGTTLLRLAASPQRPHTLESGDLQAQQVNTSQTPEEFDSAFGNLFARSDFTGGEGLRYAHRREAEARDVRRFYASTGVNVFPDDADDDGVTLLHATAEIEDTTDTNLHLAWDGTALYMGEGDMLRRSTDLSSFSDEDPHAGQSAVDIEDVTAFGEDVYAALGASGIHQRDGSAGTWSHWSDLSGAGRVWALKTFIVASTGNALYEAASGAGSTLLLTIGPGNAFQSATDAGAAILVTADDGWVYAIGDDGSGGLELKGQTFVGDQEHPYGIAARDGLVGYATGQDNHNGGKIARAYVADLNVTSFTLENARRLRTWGDQDSTVDLTPQRVLMTRDSFWFGVNDGTTAQSWRYHLGHAGIARDVEASVSGQVVDMLMIENRLLLAVSGEGLYREGTTFVSEGWLMGPLGDLFTAESKPWVGALVDVKSVDNGRVELWRATDPAALDDDTDTAWSRSKNVKSGRDESETSMTTVEGRYIAGMVKLFPNSAATSAPTVRTFAFRSYPPTPDQVLDLWVNVSDVVGRPGKRPIRIKNQGRQVYDELKGKEGQYDSLTLYATGETFRGTVEKVRMAFPDEQQRWSVPVALVRFRGRRAPSFEGSNAGGALGIGLLGVSTAGGIDP